MQKISVSGPAELVTIVPYHLGFQPERSVVVICLHAKAVGLVARVDVVGRQDAPLAAAQLCEPIQREAPSSVVLVSFEDRAGESRPLADALGAALGLDGIPVDEDLVVRDGRWYCTRDDGCAEDGEALPVPSDVPAVAGYVAQGRSVLGDRRAVESLITPQAEAHDEQVALAVAEWRRRYRRARQATVLGVARGEHGGPASQGVWDSLTDECLDAWGVALRGATPGGGLSALLPALVGPLDDLDLRDALVAWLCPGWLPLDAVDGRLLTRLSTRVGPLDPPPDEIQHADVVCDGRTVQDALLRLCRVTPVRFAAPVLTIAAAYSWSQGDGTRAGICVDRALEIDPGHRLASLIRLGLEHGVRMPAA